MDGGQSIFPVSAALGHYHEQSKSNIFDSFFLQEFRLASSRCCQHGQNSHNDHDRIMTMLDGIMVVSMTPLWRRSLRVGTSIIGIAMLCVCLELLLYDRTCRSRGLLTPVSLSTDVVNWQKRDATLDERSLHSQIHLPLSGTTVFWTRHKTAEYVIYRINPSRSRQSEPQVLLISSSAPRLVGTNNTLFQSTSTSATSTATTNEMVCFSFSPQIQTNDEDPNDVEEDEQQKRIKIGCYMDAEEDDGPSVVVVGDGVLGAFDPFIDRHGQLWFRGKGQRPDVPDPPGPRYTRLHYIYSYDLSTGTPTTKTAVVCTREQTKAWLDWCSGPAYKNQVLTEGWVENSDAEHSCGALTMSLFAVALVSGLIYHYFYKKTTMQPEMWLLLWIISLRSVDTVDSIFNERFPSRLVTILSGWTELAFLVMLSGVALYGVHRCICRSRRQGDRQEEQRNRWMWLDPWSKAWINVGSLLSATASLLMTSMTSWGFDFLEILFLQILPMAVLYRITRLRSLRTGAGLGLITMTISLIKMPPDFGIERALDDLGDSLYTSVLVLFMVVCGVLLCGGVLLGRRWWVGAGFVLYWSVVALNETSSDDDTVAIVLGLVMMLLYGLYHKMRWFTRAIVIFYSLALWSLLGEVTNDEILFEAFFFFAFGIVPLSGIAYYLDDSVSSLVSMMGMIIQFGLLAYSVTDRLASSLEEAMTVIGHMLAVLLLLPMTAGTVLAMAAVHDAIERPQQIPSLLMSIIHRQSRMLQSHVGNDEQQEQQQEQQDEEARTSQQARMDVSSNPRAPQLEI